MKQFTLVPCGLGHILANNFLAVPIYQRAFLWDASHVKKLLTDINRAMTRLNGRAYPYFLGSIVVIERPDQTRLEVVDGQQRLATTSIIVAAIRDYLLSINDTEMASDYERDYLRRLVIEPERGHRSKIALNETDDEFYKAYILETPSTRPAIKKNAWGAPSHKKLHVAYETAREFVHHIAETNERRETVKVLNRWVTYLRDNAQVVLVRVADDADAFEIFETLNDRGLDLTIADLLKNYVFSMSQESLHTVRAQWAEMAGALKTIGKKDRTVDYIRQLWGSMHGVIRGPELFSEIKDELSTSKKAVAFTEELSTSAPAYAGILNTNHEIWDEYGQAVRNSLIAFRVLRIERVRPLLLSIVKFFKPNEASKAIRFLEAACVRFTVAAVLAGTVEEEFTNAAVNIRKGQIKNAKDLGPAITSIPNDSTFETAFRTLRVGVPRLARYYLSKLDSVDDPDQDRIVNPDEAQITLEHILPEKDRKHWQHIPSDKADDLCRRLGNMALLRKKLNNETKSNAYAHKVAIYTSSASIRLTSSIPVQWPAPDWDEQQINDRQEVLASLAIKAWPHKPPKQ